MKQLTEHKRIRNDLFDIGPGDFTGLSIEVFRFQYEGNQVYRAFCNALGKQPHQIKRLLDIPFLPIRFFKNKEIKTTDFTPGVTFESSGTTGSTQSRHFVKDPGLYRESFSRCFRNFYGDPKTYCILGLLPSYLEKGNSSLVWMVDELISRSEHPGSGFYLNNFLKLKETLLQNETAKQPTILFGVTYALLDFFEQHQMHLQHTMIIETGGMKGRKAEMTRFAVHEQLKQWSGLQAIHSEYGMTELLSQAYSKSDAVFHCPGWMKVLIRSEDDPLEVTEPGGFSTQYMTGAVNIIDLANLYSCAFIATDDLAKLYPDGSFEILGRIDNSDTRGCSLLYF